jgi:hypothetical protein
MAATNAPITSAWPTRNLGRQAMPSPAIAAAARAARLSVLNRPCAGTLMTRWSLMKHEVSTPWGRS